MEYTHDYIVIGGGSGGLASARRAAQHGAKVILIEKGRLGGTCVNVGCVPKKVMFNASSLMEAVRQSGSYCIETSGPKLNFSAFTEKRHAYIERLNSIYQTNLKKDGVQTIHGHASFISEQVVEVDGEQKFSAPHILIATGGRPTIPKIEGSHFGITSDGFFALDKLPKKALIVGAGYIATEIAGVLNGLGSEVHLVLRKSELIKNFDTDLRSRLKDNLLKDGVQIHEKFDSAKVTNDNGICLHSKDDRTIEGADTLIWAIGRNPLTQNLGLEKTGVELDTRGYIKVDQFENTTVKGIYALGDVNGKIELTPVAIAAGRKLSERLFNSAHNIKQDYESVPTVMFTHPPIGSCGLTEQEAKEKYPGEVKVYTSSFNDLFYSMFEAEEKTPTFMKLITTGKNEKIVGIHCIGRSSDEMIQGFSVALKMGATKADFDQTVAIHPTASEEFVTMR